MTQLQAKAVKAVNKSYGYSVKIVAGKIPSYVTKNPYMWFRYKRDAQAAANRINNKGKV